MWYAKLCEYLACVVCTLALFLRIARIDLASGIQSWQRTISRLTKKHVSQRQDSGIALRMSDDTTDTAYGNIVPCSCTSLTRNATNRFPLFVPRAQVMLRAQSDHEPRPARAAAWFEGARNQYNVRSAVLPQHTVTVECSIENTSVIVFGVCVDLKLAKQRTDGRESSKRSQHPRKHAELSAAAER